MEAINNKIDNIKDNLEKITNEEYKKHNYVPVKREIKEPKGPKDSDLDINILNSKVKKMIKNKKPDEKSGEKNNGSLLSQEHNMYNIVENSSEYTEWRKLQLNEKMTILESFLNTENSYNEPYPEDIKNELRKMVRESKILYKKDITYDKVNKKILAIPILKYIDGKFVLQENIKIINVKKKNSNNINKLFK